ncbi:class I SAM-dependent methyltransferase [Ruegeria sp. HKCCSP346]|uniref:class I SAM-dependent methyltransferase n=1 Tax=Ruegeria sp. HKCCSP346 TaxID=2794830 RepID=UPI001AE45574|nr:class I SAM-dependent methyltransferase [Ruegeria sp. HKCCSP346]
MSIEQSAYEQNYQQFRSLNQIMWQIPVLAMTLTGGLWFGVSRLSDAPLLTSALLLTAVFGNLMLAGILYRFRHVMQCYLDWLEEAFPEGFVNASPNSSSKSKRERFRNTNKKVRTLFSYMLYWASAWSLVVFLGYWYDREWSLKVPNSGTAVAFYDAHAATLADGYESVAFEDAYPFLVTLFEGAPLTVVDIGAGTGRDAAWIAERGHTVFAVEPSESMRTIAQKLHDGLNISWIDDRLPRFSDPSLEARDFDVVLANAVWMHIPRTQRDEAMRQLHSSTKPEGSAFVSLRLGPQDSERGMFEISSSEFVARAENAGFTVVPMGDFADLLERPDVSWKMYRLDRTPES